MRTRWMIPGLTLAIVVAGLVSYRSCGSSDIRVAPDAAETIEKAKRR